MASKIAKKKEATQTLKIWQWNCRGINRKRQNLLHLCTLHQPDVVALQETETNNITMRGYETHIASGRTRTAVLIKKHHTTQQHQINHRIEHTLIELVPHKKTLQSLYILNVYSPPRDTLKDLDKFLREVKSRRVKNSLWWATLTLHTWLGATDQPTRRVWTCTTRHNTTS